MGLSLIELPLPIKIVPAAPVTDEQFLAFSRANEPYRFEKNANGEIVMMTPAGRQGDEREVELASELRAWARLDGRGEVNGANAGWNLPDGSTRSPDASWTSRQQLARFSAEEQEHFLPICPEFIAEIRSRSDSIGELREKMDMWMANGAKLAWLIDPYAATVYVYRPSRELEILHKPEFLHGEGPIQDFHLPMERFWA
jgi:Uma2 family endonuclease